MFFGIKFEKIGLVFLVLLAIGVFSYAAYTTLIPSPGHGGDKIYVDINGNVILLQDAIDQNKLMGNYLKGTQLNSTLPNIEIGHFGTNVLVRVSGSDQNLQAAINSGSLCSKTPASAYTSPAPNPGHYASSILIRGPKRIEETLQNAIDSNEFCACGNSICENGLNGNPDFNENCSNCNSDCGNCTSCTSEPDANFCNRNNAHCGYFKGLDNCGIDRNVNCGTCTLPQTCGGSGILNQCGCTPDSNINFCSSHSILCGNYTGLDNCNILRTVNCGVADSNAKFCADHDVSCGYYRGLDNCNQDRNVNCGACACVQDSNAVFCASHNAHCGYHRGLDNCGIDRNVNCGTCTSPLTCGGSGIPNICGCTPNQTDSQLCVGHCGSNYTITDSCGVTRNITCSGCTLPHTCVSHSCTGCYVDNTTSGNISQMFFVFYVTYSGISKLNTDAPSYCTNKGYRSVSPYPQAPFPTSGTWQCTC